MQGTFWWLQPPLQHKDEPAGHRSQELPYPLSALSVERKYMEIDIESQLSVSVGRPKEKRRIQPARLEQGFPRPQCQTLWCNGNIFAQVGTEEQDSLGVCWTSWVGVEEHSKASKSHISAHLYKQGCWQRALL